MGKIIVIPSGCNIDLSNCVLISRRKSGFYILGQGREKVLLGLLNTCAELPSFISSARMVIVLRVRHVTVK